MKRSLLIVCILALGLLICGCTVSDHNALPSDKYVVVYEEIHETGQIVSGSYPYPGDAWRPIQFFYNKSEYSALDGAHPINGSLKILFAHYMQKESIVGLMPGLSVFEIYDFPNTPEPGLTIIGVDNNGTVNMTYNNESVILTPGSSWAASPQPTWNETNTVTYSAPGMSGQNNTTEYPYTIQYTRTITIENRGVIAKE